MRANLKAIKFEKKPNLRLIEKIPFGDRLGLTKGQYDARLKELRRQADIIRGMK